MRALLRASSLVDGMNRRIGRVVAWLSLAMVLVGAFNAVARYLGRFVGAQLTSNALVELQWYLFTLLFLLGAPYVLRCGGHVRVDLLYGRLSERARAWIDLAGGLLFLLPFCAFAAWITWPAVRGSWAVRETSTDPQGLARYPIKTAVLVSFALLGLQGLSEIVKRVAFLRGFTREAIGLDEADGAPTAGEGQA